MRRVPILLALGLVLFASAALAQAPGLRMAFADNALFGSSSSGCTKTTTAGGGEVIVRCTPGANAYFDIPIWMPPVAEWSGTTFDYRIHWSKADAGATTCKMAACIGVLNDIFATQQGTGDWTADADVDCALGTYSKSSANVRYVGTPDNTWTTARSIYNMNLATNCNAASTCANLPALLHVKVDATSTSTGCEIRAVEFTTKP